MPELPEVETIRRGLLERATGRTVTEVWGHESRLFRNNPNGSLTVKQHVVGKTVLSVERRGKFLWFTFAEDPRVLVVHLGMSGQILVETGNLSLGETKKHEHLRLRLDDGHELIFVDQRTFGHFTVSDLQRLDARLVPATLSHVAPDPLEKEWDLEPFVKKATTSRRKIKTLLLDQTLISGIGNIYADEALFRSGVRGALIGANLDPETWTKIVGASVGVMQQAIEAGGTSFDSLYVDVQGNPGYFARNLTVYGRAQKPCLKCGTKIAKVTLDGRSHYYCPRCQRG